MTKWKEYILPTLIALCAIAVSASAAIYSVSGLAKLFAGASLQVMVMAGSLEIAKLVIATLLHQYWQTINKLLKIYLTISVVILVFITSMGIYGFLSSAYQNTAIGFETAGKEVAFLKQKEAFYQKDLDRLDGELNRISNTISELSKAKAREVSVSDGRGGITTSISTAELKIADSRIKSEETNRASVLVNRNVVADSLKNIQTKILTLEVEASSNAELGPLIYLSELTGKSMDQIINILLLVIIFVFDPLAISLVLAANFAFERVKNGGLLPPVEGNVNNQIRPGKSKVEKKRRGRKKRARSVESKKNSTKQSKPVETVTNDEVSTDTQEESAKVEGEIISNDSELLPEIETKQEQEEVILSETEYDIKEDIILTTDVAKNTSPEEQIEPFDVSYTGVKFTDIVKVLQKTPNHFAVLLRDGRRLRLSKDGFMALQREQEQNIQ